MEYNGFEYRVKKMNAIEALALKSATDLNTVDNSMTFFNNALERLEVKVADVWLPVKEKNKQSYMPNGIDNDIEGIQKLIEFFMNEFMKPFFKKSDELKA